MITASQIAPARRPWALNRLMRSYAARHHEGSRPLLLVAQGRVQTDPGGPNAR